ncbi:MAG: ribosome silencing factor [Bacteroidetes bacterium]|nr:ribosome silencing factor [Bacteroidota bacterium]
MAKIPVKKAATKKASSAKKASPKKAAAKKVVKKPLTEKEELQKEANRIANTENKKKISSGAKRPKKAATKEQTTGLLDAIVAGMQDKKAKNITVLNLIGLEHRVADYFVICDADSTTHVAAIADSLEESVIKKTGERPYRSEGYQNAEWILIDYVNIVAHVFMRETREFYNVEGLWADAEITKIAD